jgi:chemotaxis protein MotB
VDSLAKKHREPINTSAWLNTYADLVTLLLCFFVLLYSMSVLDAEKWQRFAMAFKDTSDAESFLDGIGQGDTPAIVDEHEQDQQPQPIDIEQSRPQHFDDLYDYLVAYTEDRGMTESVDIEKGENVVYIRFNNNLFFFPDSARLKQDSMPLLDFLGDCLYSVESQIYLININGHTASVDYEFYPVSSWTLSGERATNIAIYFEDEKGIDPRKLRPIGYGDNYPIAPNDTDENRRLNRRVDMVVVSNTAADEGFYGALAGLFDPATFPQEGGYSNVMTPGNDSGLMPGVSGGVHRNFGVPAQPGSLLPEAPQPGQP